jgi:uncharacterized delta-60 repeat protein
MKKHRFTILLLTIIFSASAIVGRAQTCPPLTSGCLDTTFGTSGEGTTLTYVSSDDNYLYLENSATQTDGKILGLFDAPRTTDGKDVVVRYNADGTLDSSFAGGGILYVNWNIPGYTTAGYAHAIAIQNVGGQEKILVAGQYSSQNLQIGLQVDRYNPDGTLDTTFGSGGTVKYNVTYARMMTVQPDGKILTTRPGGDLVRLNANGTLDTTFGTGGVAPAAALTATSVAVQSTGRIVLSGYTTTKGRDIMTVARYNANGSPDDGSRKDSTPSDSFGAGGKRTIEIYSGGWSRARSLKIDASDKILAAGGARPSGSNFEDFAVARLTTNGQFDTGFDGDGKAAFDFSPHDYAASIALQSDGKIILAGNTDNAANTNDSAMIRVNSNGTLDTGFGAGGVAVSDFSTTSDPPIQVMIQLDPVCACEKIVALGTPEISGVRYAIAARYLP